MVYSLDEGIVIFYGLKESRIKKSRCKNCRKKLHLKTRRIDLKQQGAYVQEKRDRYILALKMDENVEL